MTQKELYNRVCIEHKIVDTYPTVEWCSKPIILDIIRYIDVADTPIIIEDKKDG